MEEMKISIAFLLLGVFLCQVVDGKLKHLKYGEEMLEHYANNLVKPLVDKTSEWNQTLQNYWSLYDQNMKKIDSKFNNLKDISLNVMDTQNNTCQELMDTMATAQDSVNNATVILVEVAQKMGLAANKDPSCLTINPFTALSCTMHKLQDIKNIYLQYKDVLISNDLVAAKAMEQIFVEFIKCLRRL